MLAFKLIRNIRRIEEEAIAHSGFVLNASSYCYRHNARNSIKSINCESANIQCTHQSRIEAEEGKKCHQIKHRRNTVYRLFLCHQNHFRSTWAFFLVSCILLFRVPCLCMRCILISIFYFQFTSDVVLFPLLLYFVKMADFSLVATLFMWLVNAKSVRTIRWQRAPLILWCFNVATTLHMEHRTTPSG